MMKKALMLLSIGLAGCASFGAAGDYEWSVEAPESVDRGADFVFTVNAVARPGVEFEEVPIPEKAEEPEQPGTDDQEEKGQEPEVPQLEDFEEERVEGMGFHYMIVWPGGSTAPVRRYGRTGEEQKVRARVIAGTATLLVHMEDIEGVSIKVAEASFKVK